MIESHRHEWEQERRVDWAEEDERLAELERWQREEIARTRRLLREVALIIRRQE